MRNLDRLAAKTAQEIVRRTVPEGASEVKKKAKALDNMATKALGVLQENGVYAGMLFLYANASDVNAKILYECLLGTFGQEELAYLALTLPENKDIHKWQDVGKYLVDYVCNDLDTLLLVKQVWEQTLIYTRYGAKARG